MKNCLVKIFSKPALISLFLLYQTNISFAQDKLSTLPDTLVKERIDSIQEMFDKGRSKANLWWYGWLAGYGAVTIGQSAYAFSSDSRKTQEDMTIGAVVSFIGMIGQIIDPMVPGSAPDILRNMPESTPEERRLKLIKAEILFKKSMKRERNGRSWETHIIAGSVNLASGLVVWLGFHRSIWEGLGNFALGMAVTEIQIFSQPKRAIHDYENYIEKYGNSNKLDRGKDNNILFVCFSPKGISVGIRF